VTWTELHPFFNASLNATCAVLIILGLRAIKRRERDLHKRLMLAAFAVSSVFLVSYLARLYLAGTTQFMGEGLWRPLYFTTLFSHMVLAASVPVLALRTIYLGLNERDEVHRRWGKVTFPIWLYVSITGVIVTLLLYVYPGRSP
jgi:uncharacterized membrane protein YozB (DUF420 family)